MTEYQILASLVTISRALKTKLRETHPRNREMRMLIEARKRGVQDCIDRIAIRKAAQ